MATTVQNAIDRAVALSVSNQGLAGNLPDLIYRINTYQRQRWTEFTQANRTLYQIRDTVTSTAANGNRVADLTTLTLPPERVIAVSLPSGTKVSPVDLQDVEAELSPRYYPSDTTLREVSSDWDITSANAVILTVDYVWHPADLDVTGITSQLLSIPDAYVGCLSDQLGAYFSTQDVGRDPGEYDRLMKQSDAQVQAWILHGANLAGTTAYRFGYPTPSPQEQR